MTYISENVFAVAGEIQNLLADVFGSDLGPNLAVSQVYIDSNGFPAINVGAGTTGTQSFVVEVRPVASTQNDSLGLVQNVYTPSLVNVAAELASAGVLVLSAVNQQLLWSIVTPFGTELDLYAITNGTFTFAVAVGATNGGIAAGVPLSKIWGGISQKYPQTAATV